MKEERIVCDNDNCNGGKYFFKCGNGHDICSLCVVEVWGGKKFCPICIEKAKLEEDEE